MTALFFDKIDGGFALSLGEMQRNSLSQPSVFNVIGKKSDCLECFDWKWIGGVDPVYQTPAKVSWPQHIALAHVLTYAGRITLKKKNPFTPPSL